VINFAVQVKSAFDSKVLNLWTFLSPWLELNRFLAKCLPVLVWHVLDSALFKNALPKLTGIYTILQINYIVLD